MKKLKVVSKILEFTSKHEMGIRAGVIIGSTLAAVYFAAKDSPKIMKRLEELNAEGASNSEKAKAIIPMTIRTAAATATAVVATVSTVKEASDLAAAVSTVSSVCSMNKTRHEEFVEKAKDIVGEEKVQEINRAVADDKYPGKQANGSYVPKVTRTGHGDDLFYCPFSDDWFTSDVNYIRNVFLNVKNSVLSGYDVYWNEVAGDLGLPCKDVAKHWRWTDQLLFRMSDDELVHFDCGINDDNKVYTILELRVEPELDRKGR